MLYICLYNLHNQPAYNVKFNVCKNLINLHSHSLNHTHTHTHTHTQTYTHVHIHLQRIRRNVESGQKQDAVTRAIHINCFDVRRVKLLFILEDTDPIPQEATDLGQKVTRHTGRATGNGGERGRSRSPDDSPRSDMGPIISNWEVSHLIGSSILYWDICVCSFISSDGFLSPLLLVCYYFHGCIY